MPWSYPAFVKAHVADNKDTCDNNPSDLHPCPVATIDKHNADTFDEWKNIPTHLDENTQNKSPRSVIKALPYIWNM